MHSTVVSMIKNAKEYENSKKYDIILLNYFAEKFG